MYRRIETRKRSFLFSIIIFFISGCASVRHATPPDLLSSVRVSGMQDIRAFSGNPSEIFKKDFMKLLDQEQKNNPSIFNLKAPRIYSVLAISGGAGNGAYGAGLLTGWAQTGTRPVFRVVTGVSVGAIIAPFVFLGGQYDDKLKAFFSQYSTKNIMRIRFPLGIPFSNSLSTTWPLERSIERYFDLDLLKQIAIEYDKGRRLYVGTTNLDAQQLVIWDMGKIASIGGDKALKLFRKIILASASAPVVFPPVYLKVEANHKIYDEMHVDGGVTRKVFFLYDVLQGLDQEIKEKGMDTSRIKYKIYVIKNSYVDPLYIGVPNRLSSIAKRTMDAMSNAQGLGDLYQLYVFTKDGKGDFNLAYIPETYVSKAKELFDLVEMQELFDLGFKEAVGGYDWKKAPPGVN